MLYEIIRVHINCAKSALNSIDVLYFVVLLSKTKFSICVTYLNFNVIPIAKQLIENGDRQ